MGKAPRNGRTEEELRASTTRYMTNHEASNLVQEAFWKIGTKIGLSLTGLIELKFFTPPIAIKDGDSGVLRVFDREQFLREYDAWRVVRNATRRAVREQ